MTESRSKRLAAWLHRATIACQIALPFIVALVFVGLSQGITFGSVPAQASPTGLYLWAGVAVGLVPLSALMWALDCLRRLFARYRNGDVLTEASAALIRQAGKALLALAVLKIAVQPLQSVLLTWQSPPGSRSVSITIGQAEIGFILVAGLLTVIGWAMTEAARIADENRAFV